MGDSEPSRNARLKWAIQIAREAGDLTLRHFQLESLQVERKSDDSPVTVADREAEQHLRRRIVERFPDDGIVGEEFDDHAGVTGFRWILDPIDGTKSFISGVPLYCTLVGVLEGEQSVAGVILIPPLGEMVYADVGGGAWHVRGRSEPKRCRVSTIDTLAESLFVTTELRTFRQRDRYDALVKLDETARLCRTWGDGYGYLLVATGRAEVMVDPAMNLWDAAAVQPIIEEAGGSFTDWLGRRTVHHGEGVATNGRVHDEVLRCLRPE
jgi:histidinol phosphatase-like enzyme (inositol monophosphatase family)